MAIPAEIRGQKYISLGTYKKSGELVRTPVWFGEQGDKLYVMTNKDAGKCKRLRNNSQARIAPCSIRGKITGPDFAATARILPNQENDSARTTINRKYWLARIPFFWSKTNAYLEITVPERALQQ